MSLKRPDFFSIESDFAHTFYEQDDDFIQDSLGDDDFPTPVPWPDVLGMSDSEDEQTSSPQAGKPDPITGKVLLVLNYMHHIQITPVEFLSAFSWGNDGCSANKDIKAARTTFMNSPDLLSILRCWFSPPFGRSRKSRPKGARDVLLKLFQEQVVGDMMEEEIEVLEPWFRGDASLDLPEESLKTFKLYPLISKVKELAPFTWSCFHQMAQSHCQRKEGSQKNLRPLLLIVISMLSYSRSHARNRLQKLFGIYFKFHGTTAKAQDVLHAFGFTMSHKWTCDAVANISMHAINNMLEEMGKFSFFLSEDNAIIPTRVFSQTLDNQGSLGNSTTATIYIKKSAKPLSKDANERLRSTHAAGILNPINGSDILMHGLHSGKKLYPFYLYQFLLGTLPLPEASYDDHLRLIDEWLMQLNMHTKEERIQTANISTKGIFHQSLDEALHHISEAHIRIDWLKYRVLGEAIRTGDVRVMETLIPDLIFQFSGSGSKRYTLEMLEAFQQLNRELPDDVATFWKEQCWLVNFSGRSDGFLPVDRAQEHNIQDIKVTHCLEGPSIDWKYLQKLHPAIPVIREVSNLIEREFNLIVHGKRHTSPSAEHDIQELQIAFTESTYHDYKKG
ncbi:hypothetical protein K435DRAFT_852138 [Dendrothele bispora CBS 962.96]|uniref:DUF6589 domain-containing protein n=1 Tax=Dendrothele bispora (strain CBS 962.96) TaxID=1314807 RepID=A0A4S8MLZ8_DENBC|nr:hypothetical protein K435DRAFT_852138 [Dendrothele bispora CBS 962.96]